MTPATRRAVVVLGMHRSGTSAVTGTAIRLGLTAPAVPLPAAPDNPAGVYEPTSVVALNHHLLSVLGHEWREALSFDPDTLDRDGVSDALAPQCVTALRAEFGDAPIFAMKDPRLCLTLPAWLPALHAVDAAVSILLVLRRPEEVILSLSRRDRMPERTSAPLWLHHVLEAERRSRMFPRAVVFYDDLLRDWRGCMENAGLVAGISWPVPIESAGSDIDGFLDNALRHHRVIDRAVISGPPHDLIETAWSAFRQAKFGVLPPLSCRTLDETRARFAVWRSSPSWREPPVSQAPFADHSRQAHWQIT